jgi:hypothetical protein
LYGVALDLNEFGHLAATAVKFSLQADSATAIEPQQASDARPVPSCL